MPQARLAPLVVRTLSFTSKMLVVAVTHKNCAVPVFMSTVEVKSDEKHDHNLTFS